ncbi:putative DNA-(apurinic or apyrimidinic site) lyase, DNA-formamidopyrimidine glycosylase [Helianthus annuus]|nr:putative DNA-(apurinic or apyrimidinic site) lyase, DNA-formamidopyrimidine glycosylase [Helianthus annuus]
MSLCMYVHRLCAYIYICMCVCVYILLHIYCFFWHLKSELKPSIPYLYSYISPNKHLMVFVRPLLICLLLICVLSAKIHPLQAAASIPKEGCAALHMSLKEVIEHSVEVDAVSRHFPVEWLIHYRWCKKPGKINGMTIEFINAGGRTTAYVPELQKLTGDQAVKAAVKPPKKSRNKNIDEAESESEEIAKPKGGWKTTQSGAKKLPAKRKLDTSDDDDTSDDEETSDAYGDLNLSDDNVEVEASHPPGRDKSKKRPSNSSSSGEDYTEHLSKLNEHIVEFKKIQQEMLELKRESSRIREERKRLFKKN